MVIPLARVECTGRTRSPVPAKFSFAPTQNRSLGIAGIAESTQGPVGVNMTALGLPDPCVAPAFGNAGLPLAAGR